MTDMTARLVMTADARQVVASSQQAETALQQLVNRTNTTARANKSAADSARAFWGETATAGQEVTRLRQQLDPLYAAQMRLEAGTNIVNAAFRNHEITLERQEQMLEQLQQEYQRTATAQTAMQGGTAQASAAMRLFGVNAQQAQQGMRMLPFQLNQMAQMGAVTGNWMQAVSIQLPDILQGFGAARLVFLGTAAGLATAFLPAIIEAVWRTEEAADASLTWSERLDRVTERIDGYAMAVEAANRSQAEMTEDFGSAAEIATVFLRVLEEIARVDAVEGLNREVNDLIDAFGRLRDTSDGNNRDVANASRANQSLIREWIDTYGLARDEARQLLEMVNALGEVSGPEEAVAATDALLERLEATFGPYETMNTAQRDLFNRIAETGAAAATLVGEIEGAAGALDNAATIGGRLVTVLGVAAAADLTGLNSQVAFLAQRLGLSADEAIRLNAALPGAGGVVQRQTGLSFGLGAVDTAGLGDFGDANLGFGNLSGLPRRNVYRPPEAPAVPGTGSGASGGDLSDHERTIRDIERRLRDLGRTYEADIDAAFEWREEALENLDAAAVGYEEFAAQVEIIFNDMLAQAYEDDLARREDWRAGIERGLRQLADEQISWADAWENVVVGTMERGEDAWVSWVTTGRASLEDLVDFALEQFARLAYQQAIQPALSGIFDVVGGLFGGGPGVTLAKSHSGSIAGVSSTRSTMGRLGASEQLAVVERGQGIFTPRQMENADALLRALASRPAGQAVTVEQSVVVNNHASAARVETRQREDGVTEINIMDQVEREMAGRMSTPGSPLNSALRRQGVRPPSGMGQL